MSRLFLFCSLFGAMIWPSTPAFAAPEMQGPIAARTLRVLDGDTIEVEVQVWIDLKVTTKVRFAEIDAPELYRPRCAQERQKADEAKALIERLIGPGNVTLTDIEQDKYAGRVVAQVINSDGINLSDALRKQNLGAGPWCD